MIKPTHHKSCLRGEYKDNVQNYHEKITTNGQIGLKIEQSNIKSGTDLHNIQHFHKI